MSSSISNILGSAQIQSIVTAAEKRLQGPITQLQMQVKTDQVDISAWGKIKGAMSSISTALSSISSPSTINNRTATSTATSILTATAASSASVGQYSMTGVKLAKAQDVYSGVYASSGTTVGSGSLTITMGSGKVNTIKVGSGSKSLSGIEGAINKAKIGVQASLVGTSSGTRLVLSGSATGSGQSFKVLGTTGLSSLDYGSGSGTGMTLSQAARNATLNINGVPVSSAKNSITNAMPGVTLTLAGSGSAQLSVSSSPASLSGAVSTVARKINAALTVLSKETAYAPPSSGSASANAPKSGPLLGDYTAEAMGQGLLGAISGAAASGLSSNSIGLKVGKTGSLTFSSATFATAYAKNPQAVNALVSQIYNNVKAVSDTAVGSPGNTGSIDAATNALNQSVTSLKSNITEQQKLDVQQIQTLDSELTASETQIQSTLAQAGYLSIFNTGNSNGTPGGG